MPGGDRQLTNQGLQNPQLIPGHKKGAIECEAPSGLSLRRELP